MSSELVITPFVRIPLTELELTYARSSGPGGQNVNKVNSKAILRWSVLASRALRDEDRALLLAKLGPKLTLDGCLIVASDRFRDQGRNREDCFEKLRGILASALHRPKARRKTKPTFGSRERARESKRRDSAKKSLRRKPARYD